MEEPYNTNDLPKLVLRKLNSAQGWLNLGDWGEANDELNGIDSSHQKHPLILYFRVEICRAARDWSRMAEISRHLCQEEPAEAGHWLNYSYSTRRAEGLEQARDILMKAKGLFKENALLWFNLACYHAQLGDLNEARIHLAEAMRIEPGCVKAARQDPDLELLWPELQTEEI